MPTLPTKETREWITVVASVIVIPLIGLLWHDLSGQMAAQRAQIELGVSQTFESKIAHDADMARIEDSSKAQWQRLGAVNDNVTKIGYDVEAIKGKINHN